jgi:hypothetical protein
MKQTAVEKMIQYFIEQKNNGVSHWCINDLIGQLYQAKEMEKNNLYECGSFWRGKENKIEKPFFEQWYNETFKSE